MKILSLLAMLMATTCFANQSVYYNHSSPPEVGLGLMFGEPTGLTGKFWLDKHSAIDVDFTYSWNHSYNIIVDYLYHPTFHSIVKPYIGVGAEVFLFQNDYFIDWRHHDYYYASDVHAAFGVRIPLGFEVIPKDLPMGFFGELAPGLIFGREITAFLQGAIGARFYFL